MPKPFKAVRMALFVWLLGSNVVALSQGPSGKKVYMVTDMEGVGGIFDTELQCTPYKSPRWSESVKLLTGEINAAVRGLFEGGATEVIVWDGHWAGENLSTLDLDPKVKLLTGGVVSPTLELDSSYAALLFIGQHPMAGAEKGVLSHSYDENHIQNIWVNGKATGEIGARVMLAGTFGIPAIMLSGDTAACRELRDLVGEAECAEVKSGVSRNAAFMLSHQEACALIHEKARRAMQRLPEFKPYTLNGAVEVKVEFTPASTQTFLPREGVTQLNARTWVFRGKDVREAWLKYSAF